MSTLDRRRYRRRRLRGTFAPFARASDSPIAIACLRLLTFGCRPLPDFSVPRFARPMALRTVSCAFLPYRGPLEPRRLAIAPSLLSVRRLTPPLLPPGKLDTRGPIDTGASRARMVEIVARIRNSA